jgi:hypothetical protein
LEKAQDDESKKTKFTTSIKAFYEYLERLGFLPTQLYPLDIFELTDLLTNRKQGLAYELWKSFVLNRYILAEFKDIPKTPEEACPELYPPKKKYKMPDFLKEKWQRREAEKLARGSNM